MNKDISDTSVEQGWKSMLSMLDTEMPRKKQRRFLWWWLLAASVGGIVSYRNYSDRFADPANNSVPRQHDISVPMASLVPASKIREITDTPGKPHENRTVPRRGSLLSGESGPYAALSGTSNELETEVKARQIPVSDSTFSADSDNYPVRDIPVLTCLPQMIPDIVSMGEDRIISQPVSADFSSVSTAICKKAETGITVGAITGRAMTGVSAGFIHTRHVGRRIAVRGGFSMAVFLRLRAPGLY